MEEGSNTSFIREHCELANEVAASFLLNCLLEKTLGLDFGKSFAPRSRNRNEWRNL